MSVDGQSTLCRRNTAENFNRLSRAHERYRQTTDRQTDGRAIAYSEREREFTFAKNVKRFTIIANKKNVAPKTVNLLQIMQYVEQLKKIPCFLASLADSTVLLNDSNYKLHCCTMNRSLRPSSTDHSTN